jgi:hypothetical protein
VEKGETNPLVVLATQSTHLQKTSQLSAETIQDIFADDIRHHTGTAAERSRVLVGEIKATCR